MKTRLILEQSHYTHRITHTSEIICKNIQEITINDITYFKYNYSNSVQIQNFYKFILENKNNITYINYTIKNNRIKLYLKNGKYHSVFGPAQHIFLDGEEEKMYYIDGVRIRREKWKKHPEKIQYLRELKLERVLKKKNKIIRLFQKNFIFLFYYIIKIMEREYGNELQDSLSKLLSINGFRWVSRAGNSGWSKEFCVGQKEKFDSFQLKMINVKKYIEYTISINENNILKITNFDNDRWQSWNDNYRGFCDTINDFHKIINRLDLVFLLHSKQ